MSTHSEMLATLVGAAAFLSMATGHADQAAQASRLTGAQIEAATTSSDHVAIARAYEDDAAALEKQAQVHETMVKAYQSSSDAKVKWKAPAMSSHCERLASLYRLTAQEARALAAEHRALAEAMQQ